jgi:hypothetical protein
LKCKKIGSNLLTSGILTKSVKRFEKGLPEWTPGVQESLFPGMEPKTVEGPVGHGNAGYIINALWTEFERLCVTFYTDVRTARLSVEIPLGGDGGATVVDLPLGDYHEVTERKRVKPRKKKEEVAEPDARLKRRIKLEAVEPEEETKKKRARNNGEDS